MFQSPAPFVETRLLTVCVHLAFKTDGRRKMAKNIRLKAFIENMLKERGPMNTHEIMAVVSDHPSTCKLVGSTMQLVMAMRRDKRFGYKGEQRVSGIQDSHLVKVWYARE